MKIYKLVNRSNGGEMYKLFKTREEAESYKATFDTLGGNAVIEEMEGYVCKLGHLVPNGEDCISCEDYEYDARCDKYSGDENEEED